MVLYLREVNKFLALVCLIRGDKFEKQGAFFRICSSAFIFLLGLIDYNFDTLKKAIVQVLDVARLTTAGR